MSETKRTFHNVPVTLSVIIPCYNEESTLAECIEHVMAIADDDVKLELLIVDDGSQDESVSIARQLQRKFPPVKLIVHDRNKGKGAALHTGFASATGDFIAVQDADLEYDPQDLKKLLGPLIEDKADVVIGSRFSSGGTRRVLYFWHSAGNRLITLLSNFLTDLNLTDIESCYKIFKREVLQSIELKEKRFGFEPEIVAKIGQKRLRIYEAGISYYGRTYAEGKKITVKDGWRAVYCILKYNLHKAPWPVQFIIYLFIGGCASVLNVLLFMILYHSGISLPFATGGSFVIAALFNYVLCIGILFRHQARWHRPVEFVVFILVAGVIGVVDYIATSFLIEYGISPIFSKIIANGIGLLCNFSGRRWLVFPEPGNPQWQPQNRI